MITIHSFDNDILKNFIGMLYYQIDIGMWQRIIRIEYTEKWRNYMKAHKYWSVGALITMLGTFYTGYKKLKSSHKYFAFSSMLCMVMVIYTGHKMITRNRKEKTKKEKVTEREE